MKTGREERLRIGGGAGVFIPKCSPLLHLLDMGGWRNSVTVTVQDALVSTVFGR